MVSGPARPSGTRVKPAQFSILMSFVSSSRQEGTVSATFSKFCVQSIIYAAGMMKYRRRRKLTEVGIRCLWQDGRFW